jgi:restriction system protein
MNREHSDPEAPWNPRNPVEITPAEFEKQVFDWVKACSGLANATILHQDTVEGQGGEYRIDIHVRLNILNGATLFLLLECKHQARPVERDEVIILEGKLRDTASHKGIIFSTSGFQKGAIQYAKAHGIATAIVISGEWLYETKAFGPTSLPPPWYKHPKFAGERLSSDENNISIHTILPDYLDALNEYLDLGNIPMKE